jgi:hypothetical protein
MVFMGRPSLRRETPFLKRRQLKLMEPSVGVVSPIVPKSPEELEEEGWRRDFLEWARPESGIRARWEREMARKGAEDLRRQREIWEQGERDPERQRQERERWDRQMREWEEGARAERERQKRERESRRANWG